MLKVAKAHGALCARNKIARKTKLVTKGMRRVKRKPL